MRFAPFLLFICLITSSLWAQNGAETHEENKFYSSNGLDMALLSTSTLDRPGPGNDDGLTPVRFTLFINFGYNLNYDFSNRFGLFTGIGIKNIGFVEKFRTLDSTVKRRVYTLGVPLGMKIGNLSKRNFIMLGGGADLAFNYREKGYIRRGNKDKFNEWFSERTPLIMPHVFLGASFAPGVTIKAQYYPGNFLNSSFVENIGGVNIQPYAGYNVNLLLFSIGFDIHYKHVRITARGEEDKKVM